MPRISLDNPAYYLNRESSWLAFNRRVLEEAEDEQNPLMERLKFLSISASNLDEFFEVRVAAMLQHIEDGHIEGGPDGATLPEVRDLVARQTHALVEDQYRCWNEKLSPALAEKGVRVLALHELDSQQRAFVDDYCDRALDPLLTPITVDPAHPFPRVINKALCVAFLLRRRRRASTTYMGVVTVPRALPRLVKLPSDNTDDYIALADLVVSHAEQMYRGYEIISSAAFRVTRNRTSICKKRSLGICWNRSALNCTIGEKGRRSGWRLRLMPILRLSSVCAATLIWRHGRFSGTTDRLT